MAAMTRRELGRMALGWLEGYVVVRTLLAAGGGALAAPVRPLARAWLLELHTLCRDVRRQALRPTEWQEQIERLFGRITPEELMRGTDFERLAQALALPEDGAKTVDPVLPEVEGFSSRDFLVRLFGMREGRAIVPHGHRNMVSMHVILKGEFHVRHFERVRDEPGHLILLPTIDRRSRPGDRSSISDDKDNAHWLVATRGPAYTLDINVSGLDPARRSTRDFVDPEGAEKLPGGLLRARLIEPEEAIRRYGKA